MKQVSNFNERFKEAFQNQNRSVTEFAAEIGVSKQIVSAYLNGTRKPKQIVAEAIAEHLNVSPVWLLGYDVPMAIERKEPVADNDNGQDMNLSAQDKIASEIWATLSDSKKDEAIRYLRYLRDQSDK